MMNKIIDEVNVILILGEHVCYWSGTQIEQAGTDLSSVKGQPVNEVLLVAI